MSKQVGCKHCGKVVADWLFDFHECQWEVSVYSDFRRGSYWSARNAKEAAVQYAFYDGDEDRFFIGTNRQLTVYVRRKNDTLFTRLGVTGHWQPTYSAYEEAGN